MKTENGASPKERKDAEEMARTVIEHYFGSHPEKIEYESTGLTNFVFSIIHPEGEFVVRISPEHSTLNSFIKEQWAQKKVSEIGVPVTEILQVGHDVIPHPFMIARRVDGAEATFHPDRREIIREMGALAAKINSIRTSGYGNTFDWSENELSRNGSWKEFLEKESDYKSKLKMLAKRGMISEKQVRELKKILADSTKQDFRPALNHGDLRLKNVMVDDAGKIITILDWEHSVSNPAPQWELSIALHDLSIDEKQIFLEGYGLSEKKVREIAPLVKALNFINYVQSVEEIAVTKDKRMLEQYRTRMSGALDLYSV